MSRDVLSFPAGVSSKRSSGKKKTPFVPRDRRIRRTGHKWELKLSVFWPNTHTNRNVQSRSYSELIDPIAYGRIVKNIDRSSSE